MRDTFIADMAVLTKCMQKAWPDNKSAKACKGHFCEQCFSESTGFEWTKTKSNASLGHFKRQLKPKGRILEPVLLLQSAHI